MYVIERVSTNEGGIPWEDPWVSPWLRPEIPQYLNLLA